MFRLLLRVIFFSLVLGGAAVLMARAAGGLSPRYIIATSETPALGQTVRLHLLDARTGLVYGYPAQRSHYDFAWSPDGSRMALLAGRGSELSLLIDDLWRPIREMPALPLVTYSLAPRWSPDGSRLLMSRYNQDNVTVRFLAIDAVSASSTALSVPPSFDAPQVADWFDERRVMIRANYAESRSRFALVDLDDPANLWYLPRSLNIYDRVLPFPDGERWLLRGGWQLATVTQDNLEMPETLHDQHAAYTQVAIAPDGQRVAFISKPPPTYQGPWLVSVIDVDNGEVTTVMRTDAILRSVSWSPDGAWLLIALTPQGSDQALNELWLARPDASSKYLLHQAYMVAPPEWSP